mmetsp:Transcript_23939/g.94192  ORF Transcript_23939/g.94192 Transcript_23939/m.94192 type:complete len:166 (+) Transcript_23939:1685-2182(+)
MLRSLLLTLLHRRSGLRLIECCVTHSTDPRRLTHALKLLTMRDVNDLIDILDRTVFSNFWSAADDLSTEVLNESYFGESPSRKLGRPIENALVWLSCLIDAHFSSLILEQDSVDRLLSVLKSSREARRLCEALEPFEGMIDHLIKRKDLPVAPRPAFEVQTLFLS